MTREEQKAAYRDEIKQMVDAIQDIRTLCKIYHYVLVKFNLNKQ